MSRGDTVKITKLQADQIIQLLGVLHDHLGSAIESSLVPGTNEPDPRDPDDVANVRADRADRKSVESMIKILVKLRARG